MKVITDERKIQELLSRGVEEIIDKKSLLKKLRSGKRLRVKHGIDPTGPKIHIGRAISLWKLRAFQELGHQVVLIIGSFTAQIGDASDKLAMRKPLTIEEVKENMKGYRKQLSKILDMDKVEVHYNSEWFDKMKIKELIQIALKFTAQQMIQRKNFKERWDQGKPIGVHELLYPLLQGYDSVAVKADIEIGGSDQLFNLLVGREIQKMYGQKSQDIMTFEMLFGLDGRKMSTSWGNVVNIVDPPEEQYGKIMSMKDELIFDYFRLATRLPLKEIEKLRKKVEVREINPRDAKARLAFEIVKMYHGESAASRAEKEFNKVFREKQLPSKIPTFKISDKISGQKLPVLDLLVIAGLAPSKAEARRLVEQKGVKIKGNIIENWQKEIKLEKKGLIVQVGKRKFLKIVI